MIRSAGSLLLARNNVPIVKFSYHFPMMKAQVLAEKLGFLTFILYIFEHNFFDCITKRYKALKNNLAPIYINELLNQMSQHKKS